ncbi:uncharacterized protein ARMOST_19750 [Armillaria ostoyae]|uniref:Uncharacterized protein n=1 Tax=Armillaria ostoyae TaxID=47428 RepID=A0A284S5H1_ARMOS|nr:uncharacterized protein ARMOST_19750 [Armillaria ostoyae]
MSRLSPLKLAFSGNHTSTLDPIDSEDVREFLRLIPSPRNLPRRSRSHAIQISPTPARPNVCGAATYRVLASEVDARPLEGSTVIAWLFLPLRAPSSIDVVDLSHPHGRNASSITLNAEYCCASSFELSFMPGSVLCVDAMYRCLVSKEDTGWMDNEVQQGGNELRRARAWQPQKSTLIHPRASVDGGGHSVHAGELTLRAAGLLSKWTQTDALKLATSDVRSAFFFSVALVLPPPASHVSHIVRSVVLVLFAFAAKYITFLSSSIN